MTAAELTKDEGEAFDAAEALNVLAHDYGLYGVKAVLDDIGFRAGATRDTFDGIDEDGRMFYRKWEPLAVEVIDPYGVPEWAQEILEAIEGAADVGEAR